MSFGFSAGDFVTGLNLIKQVVDALDASSGSAADFRALLGTLKSLENAFKICDLIYQQCDEHLEPSVRAKTDIVRQQLLCAQRQSKDILEAFSISVDAYTDAFVNHQAGVLRHVRKVLWLSHKKGIAKLERDLNGHLNAVHICASALCHVYLTSNTSTLSSTEAKVDAILSHVNGLLPKDTTISTHIQKGNYLVPQLGNPWEGGAAQLDIVFLHDAVGRDVPLPIMILNSPADLHNILLRMYRGNCVPGQQKILRREYNITDEDNDGAVVEEANWTTVFQPGKHLSLNMIINATASFDIHRCPTCKSAVLGETLRRCVACQLNFRIYDRETIVEDSETSQAVANVNSGTDPSNSESARLESNFKRSYQNANGGDRQLDETRFFKRIHYHRSVPVKRLAISPNNRNETEMRNFELDLLPPLHRAATTCSIKTMAELINSGTDINSKLSFHAQTDWFEFHGATPLLIAAWFGKMKSIDFLLENGANLHALDTYRGGVLEYAICGPCKGRIIHRLLTYGADPNIKRYEGGILLHLAAERGIFWVIDLLVELGNELDAPWDLGKTPLFLAALWGHTETVRTLLDLGAARTIHSHDYGWTPLHAACFGGHAEVAELLLEDSLLLEVAGHEDHRPLQLAANEGQLQLVEMLLAHGADVMALDCRARTALHCAAYHGAKGIAELLLYNGADSSALNHFHETPLHLAALGGHFEIAILLLEHGADIHTVTRFSYQESALQYAVRGDYTDIAQLLIKCGANIEYRNVHGDTPLLVAAASGSLESAKILLENGCNIKAKNNEGRSAFHLAMFSNANIEMFESLLQHGCELSYRIAMDRHRGITGDNSCLQVMY